MSWSLGEIRALSVKAARGGGMPWGLAEEAGQAVHWLQGRRAPGVAALALNLQSRSERAGGCPIAVGAALSDQGATVGEVGLVRAPLLLCPFIARVGAASTLTWPGVGIGITSLALHTAADRSDLLTAEAMCAITAGRPDMPPLAAASRVDEGEAAFVKVLEQFAARTYAPATEASRLAGAGAGLSDND